MRPNKILLPLLAAILPALASCAVGGPARSVTEDMPVKTPSITPQATQAAIPVSFSPVLENETVPLWVTEFADPILEAVTDQKPFFQDDFSRNLGWFNVMSGAALPLYTERYDGMLFLNLPERTADSVLYHPKLDLENFVLVLDLRFVHDQPDDTVRFQFDQSPQQSVTLDLSNNRKWKLQSGSQDNRQSVDGVYEHFPPEHIPMTIIMRGAECAVYLNHDPLTYLSNCRADPGFPSHGWIGSLRLIRDTGRAVVVSFDNLKLWDLDTIPDLP